MVQTLNFINLSSQQAPNDVNWAGLVNSGVQGVLIRLGHGIIRDPCASGHIAKAKQYGLYWHGYHTYEGVVNEPQFTIKNATELGLSTSQYYFVDLTNSSDPFNDYYALHATWLSQGYSTGLLISNEDYLSKFTDSEVTASGSLRWLISDTEPANYDIWQYSSEGTIGTSSVKVSFNFAKTDKLKYNLSTILTGADINKDPYNPQTPVGGAYIGWGYDTTGLGGGKTIGYSTNGKNFYALIGPNGLVVRKSDGNRIYGTIADQIDSAISANVIPAKSAADSAVAYANDAIEKSKVNSQAIDDINSAVSDAKQGANDAMSRAMSAWDAARSNVNLIDSNYASASASISSARTEALAAADEAKKSASAAQADIVVVRSDVATVQADVTATKSDVAVAKSDIADTKTNLTIQANSLSSYAAQASAEYASTASALSDAKTEFSSDVAEAKNLANTAQTTADSAVKSAGENAKALTSQANALSDARKAMDSGIANAKELANAAQATADSAVESASSVANNLVAVASQANANANGITKVTSDVGLLQTTVADNTGDISTIQETAKQIQQAVSDNAGNITVAKQTADSAVAVASDAKSNATVAVQTASGASVTAKNAQGDATTAMTTANSAVIQASDAKSNATIAVQTASEASLTATNAQGDASIAKQTAIDASVQIKNAQGDIANLKTRADGFDAEFATANGNISKLQTDATGTTQTLANTKSDVAVLQSRADGLDAKYATAAGDINTLKTNASGFSQTLTNAQGDISTLKSTVSGVQTTLTDAQGNISTLQSDVSGLKKTTSDNAGNISTLQATANTLTSQMSSAQGDISTLKQTASGISSQVTALSDRTMQNRGTVDSPDFNSLTQAGYYTITSPSNGKNYPTGSWGTLEVSGQVTDINGRLNQKYVSDNNGTAYTRQYNNSTKSWTAWVKVANQNDIDTLNGEITANTTAINQNKNAISLKADQTTVDKINGTVSQMQSTLTVQAGQIQEKVTSSQVTGMLTGYATQEYAQGLVTTASNNWNVTYTQLKTNFDQKDGINLLLGTSATDNEGPLDFSGIAVTSGDNYTFSGVMSSPSTSGVIAPYIQFYDSSGTKLKEFGKNSNVPVASGTKFAITGAAPANAVTARVFLAQSNSSIKINYRLLKFEHGLQATPWTRNPLDTATVASVASLNVSLDGIKSTVATKADQSTVTELSNLVQTKVSSGDFTSTTTQLKNLINQRVQVGDVISQINQEAGGDTLIQVSNGKKSLILDAENTIVTGKEWIPSAAIANLTADQVQAGTLKGVKVDFRDSTGTGMIADGSTLTFDVSNTPAGYLTYNGMPIAELPDGSGGNELAIRYRLSTSIIPDDNSGAQATFSKAAQKIAYMTGTNQGKQMLSGLEVHSNNHHWLCAVNSDATCNRFEVSDHDGLNIAWHDNTHFFISDGNAKLYQDNNDSQTATKLEIHGWAWVNGWVEAAGHSTHSALSTKTDIQPVDDDQMLKMVNDTDLTTYLYKTDVASGETHRHIGLIIDDVHDVAQYQAPQDFIAPNGVSRDDDNMIGALFGAVKALTKRIKTLESKVG